MIINLKTFAQLREKTGASQHSLELPAGATLETCLEAVRLRFPQLAADLHHCRLALNLSYIRDLQTVLQEGDEVALIPPVSGG